MASFALNPALLRGAQNLKSIGGWGTPPPMGGQTGGNMAPGTEMGVRRSPFNRPRLGRPGMGRPGMGLPEMPTTPRPDIGIESPIGVMPPPGGGMMRRLPMPTFRNPMDGAMTGGNMADPGDLSSGMTTDGDVTRGGPSAPTRIQRPQPRAARFPARW